MKTLIAFGVIAALGDRALAEKPEDVFNKAKKLLAEKKYAEACPKFEESYKLDPGIGGQLNIAKCYEEWGKLGRAYRAYQEAERQAKAAGDAREAKIHDLVVQIEPQVPRLMIHIPADAETGGLRITIDGVEIDKAQLVEAQLVDPGPKQVEYQLAGGTKKTKLVPVERGGTSEITLDLPKAQPKTIKPAVVHQPVGERATESSTPGRSQRIAGIVIGGAGLAAVGISTAVTLSARSKYKSALSKDCDNMTNDCDPLGLGETHDARHEANIATIVFGTGLAAIAGGVIVYLMAPHAAESPESNHAFYVVPHLEPDAAGLVFGGRL